MEQKKQNLGMSKRELKHKAFYEERLPDSEKLWGNVEVLSEKPFPICAPEYSWEALKIMLLFRDNS